MGSAMLDGWIARGLDPAKVVVIEPSPSLQVARYAASGLQLNPAGNVPAGVVILAIKPQTAAEAMPALHRFIGPGTIVVSIMAGKTLQFLQSTLPEGTAVV